MHALWDEFEKRGMSRHELQRLSGIARPRADDFASSITPEELYRFFGAAASLTDDDALGLSVGRAVSLASLHVLGHLVLSSVSFRQALELVASTGPHWREPAIETLPHDRVRVGYYNDEEAGPGARVREQLIGVFLHDTVRLFLERPSDLVVAEFGFAAPADPTPYHQAFPDGVRFEGSGTFVHFPTAALDHRRSGADPALTKKILALAREHFGEPEADHEWTNRVRVALRTHGAPRLMEPSVLAKQLGVSSRGLWRRLAREGESFTKLLDEVLHERARSLLARPRTTCGQVAEALGYAELSSFNRAFRRWSGGVAPSEYREQQRVTSAATPAGDVRADRHRHAND